MIQLVTRANMDPNAFDFAAGPQLIAPKAKSVCVAIAASASFGYAPASATQVPTSTLVARIGSKLSLSGQDIVVDDDMTGEVSAYMAFSDKGSVQAQRTVIGLTIQRNDGTGWADISPRYADSYVRGRGTPHVNNGQWAYAPAALFASGDRVRIVTQRVSGSAAVITKDGTFNFIQVKEI